MERIDSQGLHYRELNDMIRRLAEEGAREFQLDNVNGQRYLGTGLAYPDIKMVVNGVPARRSRSMTTPRIPSATP
jgi:hypothetical protein